jgi:hypothetical protein
LTDATNIHRESVQPFRETIDKTLYPQRPQGQGIAIPLLNGSHEPKKDIMKNKSELPQAIRVAAACPKTSKRYIHNQYNFMLIILLYFAIPSQVTAQNRDCTGSSIDYIQACDSYIWINGVTYTESNYIDVHTLYNAGYLGCDSVIRLHLTVFKSSRDTQYLKACNTAQIHGITYSASQIIRDTFTANTGCDSIIVTYLIVEYSDAWAVQNPPYNLPYFIGVHFPNTQKGWAVGGYGKIIHTTNGGQQWHYQTSGTPHWLYDVHFVNPMKGWIVGQHGVVLHTNNGGLNWVPQVSNTPHVLTNVQFINEQIGWAVGCGNGTIIRTTDGGNTWSVVNSGITQWLWGLHFITAMKGWAVGYDGKILHTEDGGLSWQQQTSNTGENLWGVHFKSAQNGWAVGANGVILRTTNGGTTWVQLQSGSNVSLRDVYFTGQQNGWVVGENGTILRTQNGGNTWISYASSTQQDLNAIHFPQAQNGWLVGKGGIIRKYGCETSANNNNHDWADSKIDVYPNPATGALNLKASFHIGSVTFRDLQGQVVKQIEFNAVSGRIILNGIRPGLYTLFIENTYNGTTMHRKVAIE